MRRGLVGRRREVDVAQAAPAAASDHQRLLADHQVGQQVATLGVAHDRARRHVQVQVLACLAVLLRARAAGARLGPEVVLMAVVAEHGLARVDPEVNRAAAAAIAAVWPAARNVRLAPEGRGAVATVAGENGDRHLIKEHRRKS